MRENKTVHQCEWVIAQKFRIQFIRLLLFFGISIAYCQPVFAQKCFYTIAKNDTVAKIAYRLIPGERSAKERRKMLYGNNGFVKQVKRLNPRLNLKRLRAGKRINIPCGDRLDELGDQ